MSSSTSKPSIFTPRDALKTHTAEPLRTPTRPPRTSSPFGRQSAPDVLERRFVQAAAEAAPLVLQLPDHRFAHSGIAGVGEGIGQQSEDSPNTSVWESFKSREEASPTNQASKGRSASVSHPFARVPLGGYLPPGDIGSAENENKKRRAENSTEWKVPTSEPSHKRPRLRPPIKHFLPGFRFTISDLNRGVEPPSPLFFSNSPQPRPSLPPRFSSSEAAARMLSKARTEDSHVKTVSLARGVVSSNMPSPGSATLPSSSRPSVERSTTERSISPDSSNGRDMSNMLNSIGIVEMLEQDDRPTFVVDLADSSNYETATLRPVFANRSLRSQAGLEAFTTGNASAGPASSESRTFPDFKSWLLDASPDNTTPISDQQPFVYLNICWTCSTLRRRLRIVRGSLQISPPDVKQAVYPPNDVSEPMTAASTVVVPLHEPTDYFGPSTTASESNGASDGSSLGTSTVIPTIEQSSTSKGIRSAVTPDTRMSDVLYTPYTDLAEATELLPGGITYVPTPPKPDSERSGGSSVDGTISSRISVVAADSPSFDWTRLPLTDSMPPHIRFARSIDWASTSLGPIEHWSSDLRQMCNLIMASPHPAAM